MSAHKAQIKTADGKTSLVIDGVEVAHLIERNGLSIWWEEGRPRLRLELIAMDIEMDADAAVLEIIGKTDHP